MNLYFPYNNEIFTYIFPFIKYILEEIDLKGKKIRMIPIWKWLLEADNK